MSKSKLRLFIRFLVLFLVTGGAAVVWWTGVLAQTNGHAFLGNYATGEAGRSRTQGIHGNGHPVRRAERAAPHAELAGEV